MMLKKAFLLRAFLPVAFLALKMSAPAQSPEPVLSLIDESQRLRERNPSYEVRLGKPGPFQYGERIIWSSNAADLEAKLSPRKPAGCAHNLSLCEDFPSYKFAGLLVEGPVSCGTFAEPCHFHAPTLNWLVNGNSGFPPFLGLGLHALFPRLVPGAYRVVMLTRLITGQDRQIEMRTLLKPRLLTGEDYIISNVLEFEILPLNQEWVDRRLAELSAIEPPKKSPYSQRVPVGELAGMFILPTESALATAFEYYVENGYPRILATFYYHPEPQLACRFLMAHIEEPSYPVFPEAVIHAEYVCAESRHPFPKDWTRFSSSAYSLSRKAHDHYRLIVAKAMVGRFRENSSEAEPLQVLVRVLRQFHHRDSAIAQLEPGLREIRPLIAERFQDFPLEVQYNLLISADLLPPDAAYAVSSRILDEVLPAGTCVETLVPHGAQWWASLRQSALKRIWKREPERAMGIAAAMLQSLDPTIDRALAFDLDSPVPVPETLVAAAWDRSVPLSPCSKAAGRDAILVLHFRRIPVEDLEASLYGSDMESAKLALRVLWARDPERLNLIIRRWLREERAILGRLGDFLLSRWNWSNLARLEALEDVALYVLKYPGPEGIFNAAQVLEEGTGNHKAVLMERFLKLPRPFRQGGDQHLHSMERSLRDAIVRGHGWFTTREEIEALRAYCQSDHCRGACDYDIAMLGPPVRAGLLEHSKKADLRILFGQYQNLPDGEPAWELIRRFDRSVPIEIRYIPNPREPRGIDPEIRLKSRLEEEGFEHVEIVVAPM